MGQTRMALTQGLHQKQITNINIKHYERCTEILKRDKGSTTKNQ